MRRIGRRVLFIVAAMGLVAAGAAVSGYGSRVLSAVQGAAWGLDIERAMDVAGVSAGMTVGEAGAGDGYFTLPMARRVGAEGAVYANDISRRVLGQLESNARREKLDNIHVVEGDVDDPRFPRRDLELIVIVHAFHDFSQPVEWLRNARGYLRPGGRVAVIDRDPAQGGDGHFWPRERILRYADEADFVPVAVVDTVSRHLIIIIRPRARVPAGTVRLREGYDQASQP
jgi:ubiquinone/menaquinone biosynthesis C-methylase UbiE